MKIAPRGRRVFGPDPVAGPPPPFVVACWRKRLAYLLSLFRLRF